MNYFDTDLDKGFPEDASGENETSNSSSMLRIFSTKYLNLRLKMLMAWLRTSSKFARPLAIRFNCSSTAHRMVGLTRSGSICNQSETR